MKRSLLTPSLKLFLQAITNSAAAPHFAYVVKGRGGHWCGNIRVRPGVLATAQALGLLEEREGRWYPTEEARFLLADPHYQPKALR